MLVAFAGCDGAGKSTQVQSVQQWLQQRGLQAEIVDRWRILDPQMFPECSFLSSSRDEIRVCNSAMEGLSRAMFLFWTISVAAEKLNLTDASRVYLFDCYWMKHAAAELEYGCDPSWIDATIRNLPPADLTFYLDILPEEALHRKTRLTPYECGRKPDLNPEDFIAHQTRVRKRLRGWSGQFGWHVIPAAHDLAHLTDRIGMMVIDKLGNAPNSASMGA